MRFVFVVVFILSFSCGNIFASDTTLLYKQRIQQIEKFSAWLERKPNGQLNFTSLDTSSAIWKLYDTAFSLFFDKQMMDSLFQINQQVLGISAKYQMQKIFISAYDNLFAAVPFDRMKFKKIRQLDSKEVSQTDKYASRNFITLYFLIDGKEYEVFGFFFAENSIKLTGITEMGGDEGKSKIIKSYIEQLSAINNKNQK